MVIPLNRDTQLDRLKAAQQAAYERKQRAYEAQQSAWEDRRRAGDRQNRAYEAQQAAYDRQNAAWNRLQAVKSANGGRIESLNAQQERAYQNMKSAFESASAAHDRRDRRMGGLFRAVLRRDGRAAPPRGCSAPATGAGRGRRCR